LDNQQQESCDGEDKMDFVERVFLATVKRAPGSREQIGHTQTDNDGHERGDELETAHQILRVLHGAVRLMETKRQNRAASDWIARRPGHREQLRADSGERRLLACASRQLAETGVI